MWHKLKALLTVGCLEVVLKILWAEPDISQRLCTAQLWTTFQKCTSVVQNKVKPRNHIKHIIDPQSFNSICVKSKGQEQVMYKDISFFFMRMAPRGVFYMSSRKCQRILYLGNKSMELKIFGQRETKILIKWADWGSYHYDRSKCLSWTNQKRRVAIEELFAGDSTF